MVKRRSIDVRCGCGQALAKYSKGGKGRLVKMFFERILEDQAGIFLVEPKPALNDELICPNCGKRVATVRIVSGKYAAKINQGVFK